MTVDFATTSSSIQSCYPVMSQLRPHIAADAFEQQVRRQMEDGYRLVRLEDEGAVRAVAGFRILESLAGGRFMYIDDLVVDESHRSAGYGGSLFDWLVERARAEGCGELHLDSRVHRFDAHRFYLCRRMVIAAHHFQMDL